MSRRRRKEREYAKEFNHKGENHLRVIEGGAVTKPRHKDVHIVPRNFHQDDLLGHLEDDNVNIVFAIGPAGTGKTLISTLAGLKGFKKGYIDKGLKTPEEIMPKYTPSSKGSWARGVGHVLGVLE